MNFRISTDISCMDIELIYQTLSNCYWSQGISRELIIKAIHNSLCFGIFNAKNNQTGFARVITDKSTFAYLADVFILEAYQGKGLAKHLLDYILNHTDLQGLRRIMLCTRDAHGLYKPFGFDALENPASVMQIFHPDIYIS